MNKFFKIIAVSAIAISVSSCSNNDDSVNNLPQNGKKALVTFTSETESATMTRGNFQDLKGASAAFKWELNDKLGIYCAGSNELEELSVVKVYNDRNQAELQGNITIGNTYLGVYPKSAVKSKGNGDNVVTVTIPAEQIVPETKEGNEQYVDPKAFIQIGYTHSNVFSMMTPCSFLKFKTGAKDNITWVKVTAYDASGKAYSIVGDVTVTKSNTSTIELSTGSNTGNTDNVVTCKYIDGTTPFPANCSFGIAIRPGIYSKIVMEASDGTKKVATQYSNGGSESDAVKMQLEFNRAFYYIMGEI